MFLQTTVSQTEQNTCLFVCRRSDLQDLEKEKENGLSRRTNEDLKEEDISTLIVTAARNIFEDGRPLQPPPSTFTGTF